MSETLPQAYALHQAGRFAEAADGYRRFLAAHPKHFDALFLWGLLQLQTGRVQDAERMLAEALAVKPESRDALSMRATALELLGRGDEAGALLGGLLTPHPDNARIWNNRANLLLEMHRGTEAVASYDRAIALMPHYAEAWHNRAVAKIFLTDYPGAEGDLREALRIKPDYAEALGHLGAVLALQGQHSEALARYEAALHLQPSNAAHLSGRGNALLRLDRLEEALSAYGQSLALDPNDANAWQDRGVALSRLDRLPEALESYDAALRINADFAGAWQNRASTLLALQNYTEALSSYNKALAIAPDNVEALTSRGALHTRLQRYAEAFVDFDRAVGIRPDNAAAWAGRGIALARLGHDEDAFKSFDAALRLQPGDRLTLHNRASLNSRLARYEEARRDAEALLALDPDYPLARGLVMHARLHICDWRGLPEARQEISSALQRGVRAIYPFGHLAISDSPAEQLQCARLTARDSYPAAATPLWRGERYRHDKIRIAYLSGDFYAHAIPFLIAGVFEHHDRDRFETFAVSYAPDDQSEMRTRLERAFTRFMDVREESDVAIAAMLREWEIDIAIDLKGYTGGARAGILGHRPAPIQVQYLGYPGTMGTQYIDYLIADRIAIPQEHRAFYTEQIAYLPDTYQSNDSRRPIGPRIFTRAETGLPENGFVFCCFNGSHKIMPEIFQIWMKILAATEGSVLWLLKEHPAAAENLRHEAQIRGVAPERLVFAERVDLRDHLARLKLADLVLDTLPYGAHTTASDALWAGVPVLTRLGQSFAGRVGASLLHAVGLPELVTRSAEEYRTLACEIAGSPQRLMDLKAKLAANRITMPLFDTARMTRNLEATYREMWERHRRGEPAASFAVTPALQ
jgi:predicted O-linked N-acetylglucosamine transferase (SPINDLY family)